MECHNKFGVFTQQKMLQHVQANYKQNINEYIPSHIYQ